MERNGVSLSAEEIYGPLPDWVIKDFIKKGFIVIDPLPEDWESQVGPVSLDFHLGSEILVPKSQKHKYIDVKVGVTEEDHDKRILGEGDPFILMPEQFIIAKTRERLELPSDILGRLEGKSSLARLGIVVHLTAARFDPGWDKHPVLEFKNLNDVPVILYEGWPVCAFTFERLMAPVENPYNGRYKDRFSIHSLIHKG